MSNNSTLDIIKGALLLEHRGKALYESVAEKSAVESVNDLFRGLVAEETNHIRVLSDQYRNVFRGEPFNVENLGEVEEAATREILTKQIIKEINAAGYEAAVIAAALEFEKNAVKYYKEQEASAGSPEEKQLYHWLAKWETEHMVLLAQIDHQVKEQVWYDNSFWPLD